MLITVTVFVFMAFVVIGLISIERLLQRKLRNDQRIIDRLDLILREMKDRKSEGG